MTSEEKFHAAVNVIRSLPKNGSYQPSNELMLRFYAYFKQATLGPCRSARPGFWDVVGRAKYDAWKKLGDMSKQEAMDNYVTELHRIVETMSYTDNVANFLEAQTELDSVSIHDLELVAGDVIERVRSQPNSPFASREASPQRGGIRSSLETSPASSQYSSSPSPIDEHSTHLDININDQTNNDDDEHSDDEYIDTLEDSIDLSNTKMNGYIGMKKEKTPAPPPRASRSKTKTNHLIELEHSSVPFIHHATVDVTQEIQATINSLQADLERLTGRMNQFERRLQQQRSANTTPGHNSMFSFRNVSPSFVTFVILWPIVVHGLFRIYWANRRK